MRIKTRFVFRTEEEEYAKELYALVKKKYKPSSTELHVIELFDDSPEYRDFVERIKQRPPAFCHSTEDEVYTQQEFNEAPILQIVPNAQRGGFPQPEGGDREENYQSYSYDLKTGCPYCIRGRLQDRPLRLKSATKLGRNDISGIWWLRELIINARLKELIEEAGLTGCEFWPVIKHGKNVPFDDIFQLKISGALPPMAEETQIIHDQDYEGACPYGCGAVSVKGLIYYRAEDLKGVPDFALTREWFGVNDEFWRWPFLSQKAYQLFLSNKIKGVRFYPPEVI